MPILIAMGTILHLGLVFWFVQSVRYELRSDALCIVYGHFCLRRVPYSDIISVKRGAPFWNEHYNRFSLDPNITLRLRRGVFSKNLVINPPHTEAFIAELQSKLGNAG